MIIAGKSWVNTAQRIAVYINGVSSVSIFKTDIHKIWRHGQVIEYVLTIQYPSYELKESAQVRII